VPEADAVPVAEAPCTSGGGVGVGVGGVGPGGSVRVGGVVRLGVVVRVGGGGGFVVAGGVLTRGAPGADGARVGLAVAGDEPPWRAWVLRAGGRPAVTPPLAECASTMRTDARSGTSSAGVPGGPGGGGGGGGRSSSTSTSTSSSTVAAAVRVHELGAAGIHVWRRNDCRRALGGWVESEQQQLLRSNPAYVWCPNARHW
jgi:hypothetical protein